VFKTCEVLLLVFVLASPLFAEDRDSLRCDGKVISIGSTYGEVLAKCGEPASGSKREMVEEFGRRFYRSYISNEIEDWIYNFGQYQFQYQITFKNGIVKRIQSLGYGY
jgi:hypothetical protein